MLATATMTPERKLQRVKISLLRNHKFALMSGILMVGKAYLDDGIPTACTDGRNERYNPKWVAKLKEKELGFVVVHESMHKMYRHLTIWRKLYDEDPMLANAACDYVINLQIYDLDPSETVVAMPVDAEGKRIGLLDQRFRGMNAKQVFDILKQEREKRRGQGDKPCEGGGDPGDGGHGGFDQHDWEGARKPSKEEREELEREIDQAIRQGLMANAKVNGEGGGDLERELGELVAPKVDWRAQLAEFVKSICQGKDKSSWRRVNRRYLGLDVYMPTLITERVNHIVCAIDTSGSVGGALLNTFLSEFVGLCEQVKPEAVDLLYWDGEVAGHEVYTEADIPNIVSSTKPVGGGGTVPSCITRYMDEKGIRPDCAVVITDGYVGNDWGGDWPCPVLWAVVGNPTAVAEIGKTIHIDE